MKRLLLIVSLFTLMSVGCEDKEKLDYIDCEWAYYWTGAGNIAYLETLPNINATFKWQAEWIHYYKDESRLEFKKVDGANKVVDLSDQKNFQYKAK